nr:MAG TPA: tail protein [Caudoviricetes sp.]
MDLNRLLELNDSYQKSHDIVIKLIQGILDKGEVTGDEMSDIETSLGDCDEDYNQVTKAEDNYIKNDLQSQIDEIKKTKLDINADSIIDLLTNGGRTSALHTDGEGNIIMDVAKLSELNQVKLVVDEHGKSIQGIIADTEVEQADGSKIKLKVAFSTINQKVDSITTTVGQIEGIANGADTKAEGALTKASQIEQTVDGIKQTVQGYTTDINKSVVSVNNKFYLSNSKEALTGGSWTTEAPKTIPEGKYLWIRPTYTLKDGTVTDGTAVCTSGAKGDKGDPGKQGATGDTGVGIDHILTIYFVSNSKTTAPTFTVEGWLLDIPPYQEGKYLWSAYKIWYTDNTVGFTTPQYCSEWEANAKAEKAVSIATQTSEKFEWIVQKGSTQSSITLTDKAIQAIANSSIKLKANQITLEGIVTANGNFKILADGSIEAVNAKFSGDITGSTFSSKDGSFKVGDDGRAEVDSLSVNNEFSTDILTVGQINNSRYQAVLDEDVTIYIDPLGVASEEFANYSTFTSIAQFIDYCPTNLNGHEIELRFINNVSENIVFNNFHSGKIIFNLNAKSLLGYMYLTGYAMQYEFTPDNNGKIMPNIAYEGDNGNYAVYVFNASLRIQDCTIYAGNGSGNNSGIEFSNFAMGKVDNVGFVNCYNAVRGYVCSKVFITGTKGQTSSYAFYSLSGSVLAFGTAANASSKLGTTSGYKTGSNGHCWVDGAKFTAGAVSGSNTNTGTTTATKTAILTSDYGDTYRKTVYNNWKKDGTVRQGDYGYGDCVGCWFFGTKFKTYANKNVSKIVIKFTRQSGGVSSAVTHGVRTHNYATRPSGSPSFNTNFSKSASVAVGGTGTVTLTDATDISNFLSAKGVGLVPATQNASHYSVCSGTCKVTITYTE